MAKLTLYQFETCPYCLKVRKVLDEIKVSYTKVNVSTDPQNAVRQEIASKSGARTVPVLKIDDGDGKVQFIGESDLIIKWLRRMKGR